MEFTENPQAYIVLQNLWTQREADLFCDIAIHVEGHKFKAHKNILAARCSYLDELLKSELIEHDLLILCESVEGFKFLLKYLYTGTVTISEKNVSELLVLSSKFHLDKLKEYCAAYLGHNVSLSNCIKVMDLAYEYQFSEVVEKVSIIIREHITYFLEDKIVLNLTFFQLKRLLSVISELIPQYQLLDLICKWVMHDSEIRKDYFLHLLPFVTWDCVESEFLEKLVKNSPLFQKNSKFFRDLYTFFENKRKLKTRFYSSWDFILTCLRSERSNHKSNAVSFKRTSSLLQTPLACSTSSDIENDDPCLLEVADNLYNSLSEKAITLENVSRKADVVTLEPNFDGNINTCDIIPMMEKVGLMDGSLPVKHISNKEHLTESCDDALKPNKRTCNITTSSGDLNVLAEVTELISNCSSSDIKISDIPRNNISMKDQTVSLEFQSILESVPDNNLLNPTNTSTILDAVSGKFCSIPKPYEFSTKPVVSPVSEITTDQEINLNIDSSKDINAIGNLDCNRPSPQSELLTISANESDPDPGEINDLPSNHSEAYAGSKCIPTSDALTPGNELLDTVGMFLNKNEGDSVSRLLTAQTLVESNELSPASNRLRKSVTSNELPSNIIENVLSGSILETDVEGNLMVLDPDKKQLNQKPLSKKEKINLLKKYNKLSQKKKPVEKKLIYFYCDFCEYKSRSRNALIIHRKCEHSQEAIYKCDLCDFTSIWRVAYTKHMSSKHILLGPPFHCDHCEYVTDTITVILTHRWIHTGLHPYICTMCDFKTGSRSLLVQHMLCHTGERPFQCEMCPKTFRTKTCLRLHLTVHNEGKDILCDVCGYATKSPNGFSFHKRIHSGKVFHCDFEGCQYSSPRRWQVKDHNKRIHENMYSFQCEICDKFFKAKCALRAHKRTHMDPKLFFNCQYCDYASSRKDALHSHMTRHHSEKKQNSLSKNNISKHKNYNKKNFTERIKCEVSDSVSASSETDAAVRPIMHTFNNDCTSEDIILVPNETSAENGSVTFLHLVPTTYGYETVVIEEVKD